MVKCLYCGKYPCKCGAEEYKIERPTEGERLSVNKSRTVIAPWGVALYYSTNAPSNYRTYSGDK